MASGRAQEAETVTEADVKAFCCSLLGRRFPKLQRLKAEHLQQLVLFHRRITGKALPVQHKAYPKSKAQHMDVLVYIGHGTDFQDVRNAQAPRKQMGLRTVTVPVSSTTKPVQRQNEAWKWAGEAYPGRKNWKPSGIACARENASRARLERFLIDEEKQSEFSRAHDVEWERTLESRGRWLHGDLKLPDASSAEDSIWRKATLTSADDECLRAEIQKARHRSLENTAQLKRQSRAARGCMLHKAFPVLPAASAALDPRLPDGGV